MPDLLDQSSRNAVVRLALGGQGDFVQPLRQGGGTFRLARHAQVQRAERSEKEPRLEGSHHVSLNEAAGVKLEGGGCK